jgi:acyl-homoserine-lactone acylase
MRHQATTLSLLVNVLAGLTSCGADLTPEDYRAPVAGKVRILRDTYGVPHVVARDLRSLSFGVGYAQAEDQLENLARNYLLGEGRGAEFLGQPHLPIDQLVRALDLPRLAREGYAQLTPELRGMLDAFSAGINAYMKGHPDAVADWIEPAEPHDALGLGLYINTLFVMGDCRADLERAGIQVAGWEPALPEASLWGSNQFAVDPKRSATGAAMLSMDPHLPHEGVLRWYEMHQVGPGVNALGATFFGFPFVAMGRTLTTAWCQTVNAPDLGDVFALQLHPDNPHQYRTPDSWATMDVSMETYRVATPRGAEEIERPVLRSQFGPVMAEQDGVAYTFRISLPAAGAGVDQGLSILRANNLREFRAALNRRGLSMFNFVYADRHGDTFYISNGLVPRRDTRISSHDIRPAEQAWADWQGIHPLEDLPQVANPTNGYLMNTNSGPQNVTDAEAPDRADFPPYMIRQSLNSRARRLSSLLKNDDSVSWNEMVAYATDTQLEAAETLDKLAGQIRDARDPLVKEAWRVLHAWDQRTDLESRGAVLFAYLVTDDELRTALKKGESTATTRSVKRVAQSVLDRFGDLDVPWRQFSRIRRGDLEVGVAGSGGWALQVGAALRPTYGDLIDGRRYCRGGSSYGMIVDFSGSTRAVSCLPFGVSENPESPYFSNMLPVYARRDFKPAWFLPDEIAAHATTDVILEHD